MERVKDAISPMPKCKLSKVFLDFREPFLIYGEYCSNVTNATDTLSDVIKKSPIFEQMIQVITICYDFFFFGYVSLMV